MTPMEASQDHKVLVADLVDLVAMDLVILVIFLAISLVARLAVAEDLQIEQVLQLKAQTFK